MVYGCSTYTVVLICFTCPAITVATVILRALDRVRERALGQGKVRTEERHTVEAEVIIIWGS